MNTMTRGNDPQIMKVASKALEKYDLGVEEVVYLQHSENITFKVRASGKWYLLRLHLPLTSGMGAHGADPQVIHSEMVWLKSLRRDKLPVPYPVRNKAGDFVTRVAGADRKPVNATMLEWREGDLYTREMESEDTVAQIGILAGRLHSHASRWRLPATFKRPVRNADFFAKAVDSLKIAVEDGRLDYHDFKTLHTSIQGLCQTLTSIRKTRKNFGLLHGDLHRGNFLYQNGEISVIDFSLSAFGYFTYDLGTCLSNMQPSLHPLFLSGYSRYFPLPKNYEWLIEGFFIASYVVTFSFWLENPDAQEVLSQRVPYIAREYAARFNREERFWFQN
jgi:Ser/Thr protein kinase RdoA (MazF antagonist)